MAISNSIGNYKPGKSSIDTPPSIIRLSCMDVQKLYINQSSLLVFKVAGVSERDLGGNYEVELRPSDLNIKLFDSQNNPKYKFEVEKGWEFSVYVGSKTIVLNGKIDVMVDDIKMLSFPISILQEKDVFSDKDVKRLLDDYVQSRIFNKSGRVVGNGYCINSADKGIGALLNDKTNFYSEPNYKSQGGNGVRLKDATTRASVINQLGYIKESFIVTTDKFNSSEKPTRLNESLKLRIERSMDKKMGFHVFYLTMHGEYHVMTLLIDFRNPCEAKFSLLDQGYINEENLSFDSIDTVILLLEQRFWNSKPQHSKDIKLWKIKRR